MAWELVQAGAGELVEMRLKSHLGGPSDTFLAMEAALRRVLAQLNDNPNRAAALIRGMRHTAGNLCQQHST